MAATFQFYKDAAGTTAMGTAELFRLAPSENKAVYFLSTDATRKAEANSDPGVDDIIFEFDDDSVGVDLEAAGLKMAATEAALAAAPYDNTLSIGTLLNGGVVNGVTIWIGNDGATGTGVSIKPNELLEDDI